MLRFKIFLAFITFLNFSAFEALNNPQLMSHDGHLKFQAADGKNITFTNINGDILFNGLSIRNLLSPPTPERSRPMNRRNILTLVRQGTSTLRQQVSRLEQSLEQLKQDLEEDECQSQPCRHGAQCFDGFKKYQCKCTDEWTGQNCEEDVNECVSLHNTDKGCQNGATCVNTPGSFRCLCQPHFYGKLCSERVDNCMNASNAALCDHGTCINQNPTHENGAHYKCICDPGWKSEDGNPSCSEDVDECTASSHPCDPLSKCQNTQGSFICEPCPPGYSGNGFVCSDINECMLNNGGCSVSPFVKCTNSQGFYSCGACPTGFSGDGRTCTLTSACANHDCNSMARCVETPGIGIGRRCECMDGWIGNGIGINGCTSNAQGGVSTFNMCSLNPCRDGTCIRTSSGYSCECPQGRAGTNCEILVQACQSSPCLNLGTCIEGGNGSYICDCPNNFTGDRCQTAQSDCGGELSGISGELDFPRGSVNYGPNLLCTWYIRSNDPTKIISMHFVLFELEDDTQCSYDRLTIYDSGIVSVNQISEACGRSLNGKTVNTTGPVATLKLVTDHMDHEAGFKIHWSSIKPMCGAVVRNASSGVIKSPGYPFNYAHNLSCTWILEGAPGTHFKLQFDSMKIEYHYSCDYDILVVRNGLTEESPIIKKFCQSTPPEYILSFGPAVYLHFKTDDSESDKGFLIRYTSHNSSTCGGTLTSESGVISTPGYPSPFRSRLDCAWVIAPTNQIIDLVFTDFDLSADCEHNYLEIRKGYDAFSPLLGKYCDGNIPAPLRVYTSNLFISVKTDDSTTVGGFRSEWKTECTNIFTDQVGFIQSHGFPSNYPPNQNCTYKVEAESNTLIVIELKVFRLQNRVSGECKDYLLIIEGGRQNKLCGTQVTRSYTYRGPVVLNFVSDELQESNGFYITYMKYNNTNIGGDDVDDEDSSGNFRCGGTLTQDVGHINTGDNMLSHELDCTWIIEVSQNHIIALIFRVLDLEFSEECSFDYVKVYDDKEKEKLLGNYCGKAIPPRLNSTNNVLLIHLHTDHSELSAGFKIVYYSIDASKYCDKTFTQNSGIITSPGYPNSYERKTCVWLIKADPNKIITLNFTKFNVEDSYQCRYDYLEIRNGEYATSPLIGKYCGNEIPQNITSHTNFLYLKFVTDDDTEAEGFVIHFDSTTQGCGGTLSGESGHFTSPNYPAVPFGVAECQWKIIVSKGSKVKLRFIDFEVGHSPCDSSYVKVHNLELTPTEETLCGRIPNKLFTSEENEMLITFRSTSRFNQKGFMASYYQDCNVELSESEGVIESPNYPDTYGLGLECKWHIKGSLKSQIKLEIVELKFNYQSSCDDYIEISSNDRTQKVCEDTNDWHLNAGEKNITIKFVSAKEHRGLGVSNARFKIKYSVEGCGEKISLPSGFLTSPNYPDHYHSTDQCHWVIQVDPSKRINITIHDIDLESHESCDHDYLKIYNGANDKSKIITTLCHKQENEQIFTSLGNTVFIDFLSDYSVNGKGFNISWKTVPNNICGNYLTLESANITSPNYPQSYPHHMDCKWFIKTELGTRIKLKITDLDIEASFDDCGYDSLRIYEDHGTTKLIRSPLCGHFLELPIIITSESNYMTIWMTTDADTSHKGFAATYTTECGSTFKVTRGEMESLSSPNYPNLYKANLNCTWTITNTALDEKVTIVVSHFNLESSDNCTYDFLSIQEGESLNSPLVGKYCGNQAPAHYTSTGSSVTLNFVTDRSHENFGFKLFYTGSTSVCGLEYKSQAGTINSPNFPYVYPNNHQCIWNITAPAGNKIEISFLDFSLHGGSSCTGDKLFIRWLNESEELCSTMPLATKVYDASALMLLFQSDDSGQSTGFSLNYKTVYGGHLANWQEGAIESPNYPGLYGPNQDIVWLLTPPNSQTIRFIFESFDLENPYMDNCYDYVQISSGVDVFEKICGSAIPSPVITLKSPIKIRFVSDSADFFRGFRLTWKADELLPTETKHITFSPPLCGGEIVLDASSNVTIMIENDRNFINNNCTWVVDSLSGFVKFTIESLNIVSSEDSCPYGYLKIVDGSGTDLDKILCGSSSFYRNKEYVVHSSKAFLIYKHNPLQGFKLWATSTCDRSFEHDSGAITSPNYSLNYPVNMNCTYFIKISEWESISLTFHDIDIACDVSATDKGDYLEIYDGPITGRKIRTECGTNLPLPISSSSNQLTLRFISNGDNRVGKGFKAIYMPQTEGCGSKFELSDDIPNFTINSPNYPNLYNSSSDCVWVITTEGNDLITATFSGTFNIHEKEGLLCHKDKIIIRDGYDSQSPLIGIYCGNVRPEPITSTGTSLYLRFISDLSVDASGFKLDLKKGVCGGKYVQSQGTIVSPRYPQNYPENQLCNWVIEVPLNHYITLTFEDLDIQDCNDKLVFRDFNATGPIISEVCTSKVHLTSASNVLLIKFVSDNYRNSKGFKMNYISSSEACGGEQSMPYGVITSPNYPHPLNRKRVCEWIIKAPLGKRVEINITDFDLENIDCSANYLMVQGGMFPDSPVYTNSCRLYNNRNFSSDYNIMKIKFSTTGHGKGFSLNYNTLENDRCNRGWNKENKIIILAAYDTFHTTECSFKIDFPSHSRQKSINFNSKNTISYGFVKFLEYPSNRLLHKVSSFETFPPLGIVSPSSAVIVQISLNHRENVTIRYAFTECGGLITQEGIIDSSDYPLEGSAGLGCAWLITAPDHNIIKVEKVGSNNEDLSCDEVNVELKNGIEMDSPSLFRTCKIDDKDYTIQSNYARLTLYSKKTAMKKLGVRFRIVFKAKGCGGWYHNKEGLIQALNWPLALHEDPVFCKWYIRVPIGYHIVASFQKPFNVSCSDQLEISSPFWNTTKFCENNKLDNISVFTNEMEILLNSDKNSPGFGLEYKSVCGMNHTKFQGTLTTPNYPQKYFSNESCIHHLNIPNTYQIVLNVETRTSFYTDYYYYYGRHSYSRRRYVGQFCDENYIEIDPLNSTSSKIKLCSYSYSLRKSFVLQAPVSIIIKPSSQSSVQSAASIEYLVIRCNQTFTEEYGKIANYIKYSLDSAFECNWNIHMNDSRMIIRFRYLTGGCSHSLKIYDKYANNRTEIPQSCEYDELNNYIYSQTNEVDIKYRQGFSRYGNAHFELEYQGIYKCGGEINESRGEIKAFQKVPSDVAFYEPNLNCKWTLITSSNHVFNIHWDRMLLAHTDLECPDHLDIFDNIYSDTPTIRICQNITYYNFLSASNKVIINFVSDDFGENVAMKATFTTETRTCGGYIRLSSGETKTLSKPAHSTRTRFVRCQWTIEAPRGETIQVDATEFDLDSNGTCSNAYLHFADKMITKTQKYCGSHLPHQFLSSDNIIVITYFAQDFRTNTRSKFNLSYKVHECRHNLTYPGGYVNRESSCNFTIKAPIGYEITLDFESFSLSYNGNCRNFLKIQYLSNGNTTSDLNCYSRQVSKRIPTNEVTVEYQNAGQYPLIGFTYTMYPKEQECGGVIKASKGIILQPEYPNSPIRSYNCTWTIMNWKPFTMKVFLRTYGSRYDSSCETSKSYVKINTGTSEICQTAYFEEYESRSEFGEYNITVNYVAVANNTNKNFRLTFQQINENQDKIDTPING